MTGSGARPGSPYQEPYGQRRTGTNGFAVASLVLGILWICSIGSIAAIALGHIALAQIKRTGAAGWGLAITGLVLGYVGLGSALIAGALALGSGGGEQQTKPGPPGRPPSVQSTTRAPAEVSVEKCREEFGAPSATVVVENKTGKQANFEVDVEFSRKDGTIVGSESASAPNVPAHGKKQVDVVDYDSATGEVTEERSMNCDAQADQLS